MRGISMKIGEVLSGLKNSPARSGNEGLPSATVLSPNSKFEAIFSSFLFPLRKIKKIQSTGLLIANYLANSLPVISTGKDTEPLPVPETEIKLPAMSPNNFQLSKYKNALKWISGIESQQNDILTITHTITKNYSTQYINIAVRNKIEQSVKEAAAKYNLPSNLIKGVIEAESDFQVGEVSRAGAQGLMQLMPETAKDLGVKDPFDIDQNIDGGARYLRNMLDRFGGDLKLALAAYNSGPETVKRYNGIPPYKETTRYVEKVLKFSKWKA